MENSNIVPKVTSSKMERKKFFLYSGTAIFGLLTLSKMPFNIFNSFKNKSQKKETSIKITENPNAVKRKSRQANRGQVNNG